MSSTTPQTSATTQTVKYIPKADEPNAMIVTAGSNIDDILTANPNITVFYFADGYYYMSKCLQINRTCKFLGLTKLAKNVHIFQSSVLDGMSVWADNFVMRYISLHCEHDGKVALTVAGCHNTDVEYCYIYGNATTFSIYYAGPKVAAGYPTISAYFRNKLDYNNIFANNVVYSKWAGDAVSYSLQSYGYFGYNMVRGGKVAIYMCKNTKVMGNTIYDSSTQAIYISLPSHRLQICANKIFECDNSGIKIADQVEHGSFYIKDQYNISIFNNIIYDSKTNAIELNNTIGYDIYNNNIISTDFNAIYLLKSPNGNIHHNKLSYSKIFVIVEQSPNVDIHHNVCYSIYPTNSNHMVNVTVGSTNAKVHDNMLFGKLISVLVKQQADSIVNNNYQQLYYTYDDEVNAMKILGYIPPVVSN